VVEESIQETLNAGILIECPIKGTGSEFDPYRPAVFDSHQEAFFHHYSVDLDFTTLIAKVWVSKTRTSEAILDDIRATYTVLEETP